MSRKTPPTVQGGVSRCGKCKSKMNISDGVNWKRCPKCGYLNRFINTPLNPLTGKSGLKSVETRRSHKTNG